MTENSKRKNIVTNICCSIISRDDQYGWFREILGGKTEKRWVPHGMGNLATGARDKPDAAESPPKSPSYIKPAGGYLWHPPVEPKPDWDGCRISQCPHFIRKRLKIQFVWWWCVITNKRNRSVPMDIIGHSCFTCGSELLKHMPHWLIYHYGVL